MTEPTLGDFGAWVSKRGEFHHDRWTELVAMRDRLGELDEHGGLAETRASLEAAIGREAIAAGNYMAAIRCLAAFGPAREEMRGGAACDGGEAVEVEVPVDWPCDDEATPEESVETGATMRERVGAKAVAIMTGKSTPKPAPKTKHTAHAAQKVRANIVRQAMREKVGEWVAVADIVAVAVSRGYSTKNKPASAVSGWLRLQVTRCQNGRTPGELWESAASDSGSSRRYRLTLV